MYSTREQHVEPSNPTLRLEALQRAAEQGANDAARFKLLVQLRMDEFPHEPRAMAEKMVAIALSEEDLKKAAKIREKQKLENGGVDFEEQKLENEGVDFDDWISVFEERSPLRNGPQSFQGAPPDAFRTPQVDAVEGVSTPVPEATSGFRLPGETQPTQVIGSLRPGVRIG